MDGMILLISLLVVTPTIIQTIGLWLTYASAADKNAPGVKTTGLTMVSVVTILNIVFYAILGVILFIVFMGVIIAGAEYGSDAASAAGFLLTLVFGAILALMIIYQSKVLKMISAAKLTLTTGAAYTYNSMYVIVFTFIIGGFTAISALLSFANAPYWMDGFDIFVSFLSSASSATASICFGIVMLQHKTKMLAFSRPNNMSNIPNMPNM